MEQHSILSPSVYYARLNTYILEVGLPYSVENLQQLEEKAALLRGILGDGRGQSVLDCSCGWGTQAIPLAKLGWRVTTCNVSKTSMAFARRYANWDGVWVDFRIWGMRDLVEVFNQQFDWVISCYGLYEISTDVASVQAVHGMFGALKPGGRCYLELQDMDESMDAPIGNTFFATEDMLLTRRIICIQDWDYESESTVMAMHAFLRENERRVPSDHFRWVSETIGVRKKVLRKAALERFLLYEGFDPVIFLTKSEPWMEVQVVATRPA